MIKFNTRYLLVSSVLFILFLTGCSVVKPERIVYDPDIQLYKYPVGANQEILLRNSGGELVDKENYQEFIIDLARKDYFYPFEQYLENDEFLKEKDLKIAALYSNAVQEINDSNFTAASAYLGELQNIYPAAAWYSDMAFMQGYAGEQAGDSAVAAIRYDEFLRYSAGKYSERFRGHSYKDPHHLVWSQQREYAQNYLDNQPADASETFFNPIEPQYYFNSLQPGYTLNDEALAQNPNGHLFITLGGVVSSDFGVGMQYYRNLNSVFDINPGFFYSSDQWVINLAVPMQLYRSPGNRLGIKLSPFGQYIRISDVTWNDVSWEANEGIFNAGAKISAGYYVMQRISVGAWYTWNYYNKSRPYTFSSGQPDVWWENEYDVSLYVNLLKGFSLKGGIKTGDPVAGIYWNGTEISFNFDKREIIWRSDLY